MVTENKKVGKNPTFFVANLIDMYAVIFIAILSCYFSFVSLKRTRYFL
jgi:hypothetical protein